MAQKRYSEALTAYLRSQELFRTQRSDRIAQQVGLLRRYNSNEVNQSARVNGSGVRMTAQGPSRSTGGTQAELLNQINMLQQAAQKDSRTSVVGGIPGFVSLAEGSADFRLNKLAKAEREYRAATESDTKYGEAFNNLSFVYLMTVQFDDSEKAVRSADKAGYRVSAELKDDIKKRKSGGS